MNNDELLYFDKEDDNEAKVDNFFDALKETLDQENPNDPLADLVKKEKDTEILDWINGKFDSNSEKIADLLESKDGVSFFEDIAPIIEDELMRTKSSCGDVKNFRDYKYVLHQTCYVLFNNKRIDRIYVVPKVQLNEHDGNITINDLYIYKY